ncbi:MAG: IS200/IS605 family transposase [Proteobacteria bacterium]|nr:IS200/IS605 family transposase [Pseudomonadota bacterium]MBU4470649.1 IS200/IS605 family transposase [Pseudomonadota bacterium]
MERHLMPDHVYMCISALPKFNIAFILGFLKGKGGVLIQRTVLKEKRVFGLHFWARGYCVSTAGLDEESIRKYIYP